MIAFYARQLHGMHDLAWRIRFWCAEHPRSSKVIITLLVIAWIVLASQQAAHASWLLPEDTELRDSKGVPFDSYVALSFNEPAPWEIHAILIQFLAQLIWAILWVVTGLTLWFLNFMLGFGWVDWISTPVTVFAEWLEGMFGEIHWAPFALSIAALFAGIAVMRGRTAAGLSEAFMAAIVAALVGGMLANPVASLVAEPSGLLPQAQQWGGEIANSIVIDKDSEYEITTGTGATLSSGVTAAMMDVFVRIPNQAISYGQVLPDACQEAFTTFKIDGEDAKGALEDCMRANGAEQSIDFTRSIAGFLAIIFSVSNAIAIIVLLAVSLAIGALLIIAVGGFLIAGVKSMIFGPIAILPVDRGPLWKAVSDMVMGVFGIVVMTCGLSMYLKFLMYVLGLDEVLRLPHNLRVMLIVFAMIFGIVIIVRMRRGTLKAGHAIAQRLARIGLGMQGSSSSTHPLVKMATLKSGYDLAQQAFSRRPRSAAAETPQEPQEPKAPSKPAPMQKQLTTGTPAAEPMRLEQVPSTPKPSPSPKALKVGRDAVELAKGARGGAPGLVLTAGKLVAQRAANAVKSKAAAKAKTAAKAIVTGPAENNASEPTPAQVIEVPGHRRFEIDRDGRARVRRTDSVMIHNISSLPPRAPQASARAQDRREMLARLRAKMQSAKTPSKA
ncbi:hypothetical protein E4U02_07540 [Microbacterium paludicola]|uniref:Uncharacterized protein n=1 Tax=Microbacterium paludicola TaxID=300019 RepID=A0A4Y9FXU0_9MICO|nr:hypothetical protein [Microbacterium paludicola]MBF0816258.1 hypothetical protein [Microbacterium paludicola]TFU33061.1 hypothetical protein E4U02_07540 [Microbacterium paludicola]